MKQSLRMYRAAILIAVFFMFPGAAQQPAPYGPSYDVILQIIVGSDDGQTSELPKELDAVSRQLKSRFAFSSYRLANTFLGRVGENGNLEYKSIASMPGKDMGVDAPVFLDWSLVNFSGAAETNLKNVFHAQTFRFGARVPVKTGAEREAVINYESIGLSFHKVGFSANTPTLLGTLSLPQTAGTMFLVVTIKQSGL